jgi:hypothetical protein
MVNGLVVAWMGAIMYSGLVGWNGWASRLIQEWTDGRTHERMLCLKQMEGRIAGEVMGAVTDLRMGRMIDGRVD